MERVTIECYCGKPANLVNHYGWSDERFSREHRMCRVHAADEALVDDDIRKNHKYGTRKWVAWNAHLYNPALCTPTDLANVRAAIDAIARLCRALWCDDAESREDRDVLVLCAQEVRVLEGREEAA